MNDLMRMRFVCSYFVECFSASNSEYPNNEDADQSAHQKYHVEPAMIEVKFNIMLHCRGDDISVSRRQRHLNEKNRGDKVQAHKMGQEERDIGTRY